jgi:hypothetical protein
MDSKTLANVAQYLIGARRAEAVRFNEVHAYVKNRVMDIYVPKKANQEYRKVVEQSRFNILDLLIRSLANNFFIDGYRAKRQAKNAAVWDKVWQPNRLDARQAGWWRASLEYGVSYATVLPGMLNGQTSAVVTPWSPRRLTALYADPISDEWPQFAMTVGTSRPVFSASGTQIVTPVTIFDDSHRYEIDVPSTMLATQIYTPFGNGSAYYGEIVVNAAEARVSEHDMGVPPVVRYMDTWGELDDGPEGVVYPMLPAQRQLNQTTYSLGMAELYSAFRQKWVTGLEIQEDENGNPIEPFNVAVDKLLQAESDETKFGDFGQTDLKGYHDSRDKTLLYVASVRQIPPHSLVVGNSVSNISAEALAALEAGHQQDIGAHKTSYGESAEQMLRLSGKAMGDEAAWSDMTAQVRWRDTTPRSLAQIADALGKLAVQLGVPARALWERIPEVTDQDLEQWGALADREEMAEDLDAMVRGADAGPRRTPADVPAPA